MTSISCNEAPFSLREVGYAMSNAWPKYISDAVGLIVLLTQYYSHIMMYST